MMAMSTRLTRAGDFARRAPREEAGGAKPRRSNVEDVSVGLVARIRELSVALLGERNSSLSSTTEWRWRGKGSFSLAVTGPRAGCWFDHEAGVGGDVLALIRRERRCSFPAALAWAAAWVGGGVAAPPPRSVRPVFRIEHAGRSAKALALWSEARDPRGTVVEAYLAGRGIGLPPAGSEVLRFHPRLYHPGGAALAMIALVRDISTDAPCGIHRTFLTPAGTRFDKKMLGRSRGAAIKLVADDEVTIGLGIAEDVETALSILGTGWRPIWALGSAGAVRRFPVLSGIEALSIFADHDDSGAGEAAAEACATRWAASAEVTIVTPHRPGHDFNNCLGECA
jgi:putative DNA primase/helicase